MKRVVIYFYVLLVVVTVPLPRYLRHGVVGLTHSRSLVTEYDLDLELHTPKWCDSLQIGTRA